MKTKKLSVTSVLLCLFEALVGVLLLVNPVGFTAGIIIAAGIILVIAGLCSVVNYFRADALEAALSKSLAGGLAALIAGIFVIAKYDWLIVTFPVITVLYGVAVLLGGLSKIQLTIDLVRMKKRRWGWCLVSAIISLVCAVVILKAPFASTAAIWLFIGISLIVEAVFDIITLIFSGGNRDRV